MHRLNSSVGNSSESYLVHMGVGRHCGVVGSFVSDLCLPSRMNPSLALVDCICGNMAKIKWWRGSRGRSKELHAD